MTANLIELQRDGSLIALVQDNTELNMTISVNDSLHGDQFQCDAQLIGSQTAAYSSTVNLTIKGNYSIKM